MTTTTTTWRRLFTRSPGYRRRLFERVLRWAGISKTRAVGIARRIP